MSCRPPLWITALGLLYVGCGDSAPTTGTEDASGATSAGSSTSGPDDATPSTSTGSTTSSGGESTAAAIGSTSGDDLGPTNECTHDVTLSLRNDRTAVVDVQCGEDPCGPMRLALHRVVGGEDVGRLPTDDPPGLPHPIAVRVLERDRELVVTRRQSVSDTMTILEVEETGPAAVTATVDLYGSECLTIADVDGDGFVEIVSGMGNLSVVHYDPLTDAWTEETVGGPFNEAPESARSYRPHAEGVAVGDVDGDGDAEIVTVVEGFDPDRGETPVGGPILAYAFDDGQWHESVIDPIDHGLIEDVAIGDFDGDGREDVVAVGLEFLGIYSFHDGGWVQRLWSDTGFAHRVVAGDIDVDGRSELVTQFRGEHGVRIVEFQSQWTSTPFPDASFYDGMGFGVFGDERRPSFVVSEALSTRIYWDGGWQTEVIGASEERLIDTDFGDIDNDASNELIQLGDATVWATEQDGSRRVLFSTEDDPEYETRQLDSAMTGDVDHDEPGNPRLCGTARTPPCGEHVFALVTAPDLPGPFTIVAHATDLSRECDERSEVAIITP